MQDASISALSAVLSFGELISEKGLLVSVWLKTTKIFLFGFFMLAHWLPAAILSSIGYPLTIDQAEAIESPVGLVLLKKIASNGEGTQTEAHSEYLLFDSDHFISSSFARLF